MSLHYITLHEDPDHLEQSSHDASNICEDTEHERNPDDPEEEAEQAAAERAGCKVAVAWETQDFEHKDYHCWYPPWVHETDNQW